MSSFQPLPAPPPPPVAPYTSALSGQEPELDRFARLAAALLRAPMACFCIASPDTVAPRGTAGPTTVAAAASVCRRVIDGGGPIVVDDARTPAETALPTAYVGIPVAAADGTTIGSLCVADQGSRRWTADDVALLGDFGASVATALALRSSEERFRSLIEHGSDLVIVVDADGAVRYVTPSVERVLGIPLAGMAGRDAFAFVEPDDVPGLRAQLAELLADPSRVQSVSYRPIHASGARRVFEGTARNLLDVPGVRGIVVNVADVTERQALETQLRRAQKLEAIGLLAGGIAHDFNNLLTVIRGNLEFLRDTVGPQSQAADDLAEAEKAAIRATTLVRQLLAFGQRQARQPTVIDLSAVVADAARLVRRVVGDHVEMETELGTGLWAVRADRGQIEQVLMNLSVNARDAMADRPSGVLAIATTNVEATPALVAEWGLPSAGDYVRLTVRDTGTGMDERTKARLFEPFFTTKSVGRGTGLGLAVVYGIVAQSGGAVHVESTPGSGSRFSVFLPRVDAAVEGPVYAPTTVARGTGTILLVEDEPAVRRATRRTLERAGYRVIEAKHGNDALLVWREIGSGVVDVLVTDARMPGISGVDLVARLRAQREDLPVLLVSGYAADTLQSRGPLFGRGPTRFLEKPFEAAVLLETLQSLLA